MYHEEKTIKGVLCHRGKPDGEWIQYSKKQLTEKIEQLKAIIKTDDNEFSNGIMEYF